MYVTIGSPAFCLALYLTGVYFRGGLQRAGDVSGHKILVSSELGKWVVPDCQGGYMLGLGAIEYSAVKNLACG